jgi:hypothetical protein
MRLNRAFASHEARNATRLRNDLALSFGIMLAVKPYDPAAAAH